MASFKLTYVDRRSRGEVIRMLFHAAGREFEDIRLSVPEGYNKVPLEKRKHLPLLETDGNKLSQSYAVARYLAREFDMAGKTNYEMGLVDQYMELTAELFYDMRSVFLEKDEEKRKEGYKNMIDVTHPLFMKLFEEALELNGGSFLVGESATVADLALYNTFDTRLMRDPGALDAFPLLKAHRKTVESLPRIADYLTNRKHSDY